MTVQLADHQLLYSCYLSISLSFSYNFPLYLISLSPIVNCPFKNVLFYSYSCDTYMIVLVENFHIYVFYKIVCK